MKQTIWKYEIYTNGENNIALPAGSKVLSVKNQNEQIVMYALVDEDERRRTLTKVKVFGTGQQILDVEGYDYLDTVSIYNGSLMFHVFYKTIERELFTAIEGDK